MQEENYFDTVYQTKDLVRLALLAGYADGVLSPQEYNTAFEVLSEIANEYFGLDDPSVLTGQIERINEGLMDEISSASQEEIASLAIETAHMIEDPTLQELGLTAAIRVAYGDEELSDGESKVISELSSMWGIPLKSII